MLAEACFKAATQPRVIDALLVACRGVTGSPTLAATAAAGEACKALAGVAEAALASFLDEWSSTGVSETAGIMAAPKRIECLLAACDVAVSDASTALPYVEALAYRAVLLLAQLHHNRRNHTHRALVMSTCLH